jgi:hypothetical protein
MLEMLASDLLSGSFQLKKQGRSLPTQMLRETSVGEARRHVCAVGVRAARLASASAPYATRSFCSCEETMIRFCIRVVLALVSSTLRDTSFYILHLVFP